MRCVLLAALAVLGIVVSVRMHLADAHHRAGRAILDDILDRKNDPGGPKGDPHEAAAHFEKALEIGAEDHLYAFRRGRANLLMKSPTRFADAAKWFERAARLGPAVAENQYWWGVALAGSGDDARIEGDLEAAERFHVAALERYEAARRLAPYKVDMNRRIADAYLARWSRTRAEEDLRRAFETLHALRLVEPEASAQAHASLVSLRMIRYDQLDAVVPRQAEERRTLAETLAAAGRHAWAIRAFDEAATLAGGDVRLSIRGRMLKYAADEAEYPAEALRLLEEVRELAGDDFDRDLELGRVLLRLGRATEARPAFRRHLAAAETLPEAIEGVHRTYVEAGGDNRAAEELAMWRAVDDQYTSYQARSMNLFAAEAAYALGEAGEALVWLRKFIKGRSPRPRALLLQARCHIVLGQIETARKRLRQALTLRPDDEEIRKLAVEIGLEGE